MTLQEKTPETQARHVLVPENVWSNIQAELEKLRAENNSHRQILSILAATQQSERFAALAMAFCNTLGSQFKAERVTLGMLRGRSVHALAMSHTAHVLRKMQLVQDIESAMEECLDQDCEVIFPALPNAGYITRCAEKLSKTNGPHLICALPLRRSDPVGVLLLELPPETKLTVAQIEMLRRACDMISPRLVDLFEHDRWFGVRLAGSWQKQLAKLLGPSHTWMKAAAVAAAVFLAWALFFNGEFRITAPFTLEPEQQAEVVAPFNGYIASVPVRPGDIVQANKTTLATLDTTLLNDQLAEEQSKLAGYEKQAQIAQSQDKFGDMQIAEEDINGSRSQIMYYQREIDLANIRSPISGVVLTGDLERRIGSAVQTGDVLFHVAPLDHLLAKINVPDSDILYIQTGQNGQVAVDAFPADKFSFQVNRIDPLAQVLDRQNVFTVRTDLDNPPAWFRPGMQGTAKIDIGPRRHIWIWTRSLIDWLRLKLWI
jgi:Barrel-sandwich domain of CusB or HlyD membrane-fusion